MSTSGDIMSTLGDIQYIGRYHVYIKEYHEYTGGFQHIGVFNIIILFYLISSKQKFTK